MNIARILWLSCVAAIGLTAAVRAEDAARPARAGTVTVNSLNIRARPGVQYEVIGRFLQNEKVQAVGEMEEWMEVGVPPTAEAYVVGRFISADNKIAADRVRVHSGPGVVFSTYAYARKGDVVKKLGEPKLIAISLILTGISLAPLPFIAGSAKLSWGVLFRTEGLPWVGLLAALALLAVGSALTRPPLFGLLSNLTPAHEQGATIGVAQGAGSLARIFGPLYAGPLFMAHPALPYLTCTVISIGTGFLVLQRLCRNRPVMAGAPALPSRLLFLIQRRNISAAASAKRSPVRVR